MIIDVRSREFTDSAILEDFENLQRNIHPRASRNALNVTARKLKTQAGRISAASLGVRVSATRERIKIQKATRRRPYLATIVGLLLPIPARKLGRVRTARGVAKAGKRTFQPPAFTANVGNFTSVFKREPLPSTRKSAGRPGRSFNLPIKEQTIPVGDEIDIAIARVVDDRGPAIWKAEMERQLRRELERQNASA